METKARKKALLKDGILKEFLASLSRVEYVLTSRNHHNVLQIYVALYTSSRSTVKWQDSNVQEAQVAEIVVEVVDREVILEDQEILIETSNDTVAKDVVLNSRK